MNRSVLVETDRPQRYLKQLLSHLGRRLTVEEQPDGAVVRLSDSESADLRVVPTGLAVVSSGADATELDRVEQVVVGHLQRFVEQGRPASGPAAAVPDGS